MMIDARTMESGATLSPSQVCIAGAGAAGITLALELARSGIAVCVLESGGLDYDEATQALYVGTHVGDRFPDLDYNRLRYFGGTTNHWDGNCRPLDALDFEHRPDVDGTGWPLGKADLDPFYARAQVYCQLGPYEYESSYWETLSGLKPLPVDPAVLKTAVHQGSPPTRFGEEYRTALELAPSVTVVLNANVTEIVLAPDGGSVVGLDVRVLEGGSSFRVTARQYVVALGGIETARVMLASRSVQPAGVGNGNDLVGRYFMDHPVAKGGIFVPSLPLESLRQYDQFSLFADRVSSALNVTEARLRQDGLMGLSMPFFPITRFESSEGVESFHALRRALEGDELAGDLWEHVGNVIGDLDMVAEGVSRKTFDTKLFDSANDRGFFLLDCMMEQSPEPESRVVLGEERDALGMQRVVLKYGISNRTKESVWGNLTIAAEELGRAGVGRLRLLQAQGPRIWDELINYGHHHMGTARAHADPSLGVVDGDLRVHGIGNLYVAGSSAFTTGGHVPPTLTIVALAIRLADRLKQIEGA